jgi:thiamine-monophosphate kinase
MNEADVIRAFADAFPRSPRQANGVFESDAEIVRIGDALWGLTIDEFTPEEDLFTSEDPKSLGANLATATLSDLLACGARPAFFMQAVSLPRAADSAFVASLARGIRSVLDEAGCFLIGGDMGAIPDSLGGAAWRFCGFAMGPVQARGALTRILPPEPQMLWTTGWLGDANFAALTGRPTPRLELRLSEAELAGRWATACIDTSGGFFEALWQLYAVNPRSRIEIHCDDLPIDEQAAQGARGLGFPPEAVLLGGAGEYELLFATPANLGENARAELAAAGATPVGTARRHAESGVVIRRDGDVAPMPAPPPSPREAADVDEHIRRVKEMARDLFGPRYA